MAEENEIVTAPAAEETTEQPTGEKMEPTKETVEEQAKDAQQEAERNADGPAKSEQQDQAVDEQTQPAALTQHLQHMAVNPNSFEAIVCTNIANSRIMSEFIQYSQASNMPKHEYIDPSVVMTWRGVKFCIGCGGGQACSMRLVKMFSESASHSARSRPAASTDETGGEKTVTYVDADTQTEDKKQRKMIIRRIGCNSGWFVEFCNGWVAVVDNLLHEEQNQIKGLGMEL